MPKGYFYDLILAEDNGTRILNISIGETEAENIAFFLDKLQSPRPLTYDLFVSVLDKFNIVLQEVTINKFFDGNFHADACFCGQDKVLSFDMRPSDAVNMALRSDSPIYATEEIMNIAGFDYNKYFSLNMTDNISGTIENIDNLSIFGINMLNDLLKDALEKEDYLTASLLRDKIQSINKENNE